jgi:hypothetical protein
MNFERMIGQITGQMIEQTRNRSMSDWTGLLLGWLMTRSTDGTTSREFQFQNEDSRITPVQLPKNCYRKSSLQIGLARPNDTKKPEATVEASNSITDQNLSKAGHYTKVAQNLNQFAKSAQNFQKRFYKTDAIFRASISRSFITNFLKSFALGPPLTRLCCEETRYTYEVAIATEQMNFRQEFFLQAISRPLF